MKLGEALGGSFKTYMKKPLLFSGVYVAAMLILIIFNLILIPSGILASLPFAFVSGDYGVILGLAGLVMLLYIALSIVVGALNLGGLIKASAAVYGGGKTSIMECLKYAFGRIKDYIILALHVFWYTLWWAMIVLMILTPFLGKMLGGTPASAQSEMPAEFAEMMEELSALEGMDSGEMMEAMEAFEGLDMAGGFGNVEGMGLNYNYPVNMNVHPVIGLVFLVLLVFIIIRTLKAFFAFYILFDDPHVTPKKALEKSIALTKGNLWRLIGYVIVFVLIVGILSSILMGVILNPLARSLSGNSFATFNILVLLLNFAVAAVIGPIGVIYYYIVYKGWSKES